MMTPAQRVARFIEAWKYGGAASQRDAELIYSLAVMPAEAKDDDPTRPLLVSDLDALLSRDDAATVVQYALNEHLEQLKRSGGQTVTLTKVTLERMVRQLERPTA